MTTTTSAPHQISEAAAEAAAGIVVDRHDLERAHSEAQFDAMCWSLGEHLDYGQGLREFGHALLAGQKAFGDLLDLETVIDLVESKIELLGGYKLEYPQDYSDGDIAVMHTEIETLHTLRDELTARRL